MRIKKYFILIGVMLVSLPVFSQVKMEDVVYLKNGSVIHGSVLEQFPGQSLKIQTSDRNIYVFKMEEVEKIVKEPIDNSASYSQKTAPTPGEKGYENLVDISFMSGVGITAIGGAYDGEESTAKNKCIGFAFHELNGYKFNSSLFAGIGLGYNIYRKHDDYLPASEYIPVFAAFRYFPKSTSKTTFMLGLDAGSEIGVTNYRGYVLDIGYIYVTYNFKGGFFFNPQFGVKILLAPNSFITLSLGYKYFANKIDYTADTFYTHTNYGSTIIKVNDILTYKSHFMSFTFGVGFW